MALLVQTFSMGIVQRSSGPRGRSGVPIRAASAHHGSRVARPMLSTPRTKPPAPACPLWQKKKDGWAASPDAKTRRAPCDRIRGGRVTRRISPCPSRGAAVRNAPRRAICGGRRPHAAAASRLPPQCRNAASFLRPQVRIAACQAALPAIDSPRRNATRGTLPPPSHHGARHSADRECHSPPPPYKQGPAARRRNP